MSPQLLQFSACIIGLIVGVVYYMILAKNSKSNKLFFKTLCICALMVFVVHWVSDAYVISQITIGDLSWFSMVALAFFHALELFVFQNHFFDNGYQEYFFGRNE